MFRKENAKKWLKKQRRDINFEEFALGKSRF
jgi:hypothetical protein